MRQPCAVVDCDRPSDARGLCSIHYKRLRRLGDPLAGGRLQGEPIAFFTKAMSRPVDHCLLWPYGRDKEGYGIVYMPSRGRLRVHRLALMFATGSNQPSLVAAHGPCRQTACFNPRHLSWKTVKGNCADKVRDGTHHRGEQSALAKLTESDVRQIRRLRSEGAIYRVIAERFGITTTTACQICLRQTWKYTDDDSSDDAWRLCHGDPEMEQSLLDLAADRRRRARGERQ